MTDGEQQGAPGLSEQEELELRQLSELILETPVSDELYRDILELSEPVLALVRGNSGELEYSGWGRRDAWASFTVYSKLDEILRDLLLGARDESADPDSEDRQLTGAAERYGEVEATEVTEVELEGLQSALQDKIGSKVELHELAELLGSSVPDFLRDARSHGWSDPAALEAATNFYLDSLGPSALEALIARTPRDYPDWVFVGQGLKHLPEAVSDGAGQVEGEYDPYDEYPISEADRESFVRKLGELIELRMQNAGVDLEALELEEERPEDYAPQALTEVEELIVSDPEAVDVPSELEGNSEPWTVADDLSPEDHSTDTSDDGEWGLAEIDGEGEPEGEDDFAVEEVLGERAGHDHHGDHVHQILGDELRGFDDYDGEPADEHEIATLALIAKGIIYDELSKILLQDLLAEADPLIRKSRLKDPEWWMSIEAAEDVADLISMLLLGEPWPSWAPETSDEVLRREGNAHQAQLQRLAASYPLDPEPTRAELLASLKPAERYELLLKERGERTVEPLTGVEVEAIGSVIESNLAEIPTKPLVADVANLYSDEQIDEGRAWGWERATSDEMQRIITELLRGVEATEDYWLKTAEETDALSAAIRTYRTEELTEDEFIAHYDPRRWPSVGATVDLSIFTILDGKLQVLLIERGNHPELGKWALPGGFVDIGESLDQAALRELQEETGVDLSEGGYIEQVRTYGYPGRDRRGYIISTLYAALLPEAPAVLAGDDAAKAHFVPVDEALSGGLVLAFDHAVLLRDALERIRAKLEYSPIVFDFLPAGGFTLSELRGIYETVWGFEILPSDFFRRITQAEGALTPQIGTGEFTRGPAETFFPPLDRRQVVPRG